MSSEHKQILAEAPAIFGTSEIRSDSVWKIKAVCRSIDTARENEDFVWRMAHSEIGEFQEHWHKVIIASFGELLRIISLQGRQNSVFPELVRELFNVDSLNGFPEIPGNYVESLEQSSTIISSLDVIFVSFLNFISSQKTGSMSGNSEMVKNARKEVVKTSFFFIALHYDLRFVSYILSKQSGVKFFNKINFCTFLKSGLVNRITSLCNGSIWNPINFNASCFAEYVSMTTVNPYYYINPKFKPPEDTRVLHPKHLKEISRRVNKIDDTNEEFNNPYIVGTK